MLVRGDMRACEIMYAFMLLAAGSLMLLNSVEAGDKGDDIILTKGKLIMRGGKGKGNLILDTGSKSSEHHMMPMMPMHHMNPFSFYPISQQHHQQPTPMVHVQPIYLEDHSALHMHHQHPEHHHQQEYHHEEPHQYQHHEPEMHHQMPEHEELQHHHEPLEQHYEQEAHHEESGHGGYESNPMMSAMMMHGSGLQPTYEQLATLQVLQHPALLAQHELAAHRAIEQQNLLQQEKQQTEHKVVSEVKESASGQASDKQSSIVDQRANNPLVAMIRPLFKRNHNNSNIASSKNKKP